MNGDAVSYDVVIIGLGGMGSAALAHCAKRARRVLGIEQFAAGHALGASTGESRIIRQAYFEHPAYVPLLRRAYELWRELESESATTLLDLCGLLMVGPSESRAVRGATASAAEYAIELQELSRADVARRYPTLTLHADERGVFEPGAGLVYPEAGIDAHMRVAQQYGADVRYDVAVRGYAAQPNGIVITLADGSTLRTARLAICAGPWLGALAAEAGLPLRVQRNVQVWFDPEIDAYSRARFPVFFLDRAGAPAPLYGFPDAGGGIKAALHCFGETISPGELERTIGPADIAAVKTALDSFMPHAAATFIRGKACMYTLTPDEHFIVDTHPDDARIVIAGGFSGHGYKFCPVIGEIVAELALDGATRQPIDFLRLGRLANIA